MSKSQEYKSAERLKELVILSGEFASLREANSQSKDLYSSHTRLRA